MRRCRAAYDDLLIPGGETLGFAYPKTERVDRVADVSQEGVEIRFLLL